MMNHVLSKTLLITKVTELIASEYKLPISEARDRLYRSSIINAIDDDDSGLYGESPLYVFSLFKMSNQKK